ncbi:uncharacterized protein K444DRAFT_631859 [Hyaloscypha bicolor E]|uniref:Aminoglycoside phosphotransferase domain-containing protein n=1 Tax=Hyaloscypha bicolor E TaxID=1095630 RepID=A0A2J6T3T7_9HELO|nr:uncharacterized protein K444DRAFT_631859 [Hyaloscypha bicolor E]PMD57698.1 hypothetical protein K444DRAFT_631859 [Hyaloscypha bicolor E]
MEYVHGQTPAELLRDRSNKADWIYDLVAKAVTHLIAIPVPGDAHPGPAGSGYIHHRFLRDNDAPTEFSPLEAQKVDFSNEQLCFCYSDIWEHNFVITEAREIYVLDFGDATFLPTSFMSLVLQNPGDFSFQRYHPGFLSQSRRTSMQCARASYVLKIASSSRITSIWARAKVVKGKPAKEDIIKKIKKLNGMQRNATDHSNIIPVSAKTAHSPSR